MHLLVQSDQGSQLRRIHNAREVNIARSEKICEGVIDLLFLSSRFIVGLIKRGGLRLRFFVIFMAAFGVRILRRPLFSQQCSASEILVSQKAGQPPINCLVFVHRSPGRQTGSSDEGFAYRTISLWIESRPGQSASGSSCYFSMGWRLFEQRGESGA